jgi:hypothetical protein
MNWLPAFRWSGCGGLARSLFLHFFPNEFSRIRFVSFNYSFVVLLWLSFLLFLLGATNMDSDPSLRCSDTGDNYYPLSDLSDSLTLAGLIVGPDDLAATLVRIQRSARVESTGPGCGSQDNSLSSFPKDCESTTPDTEKRYP